MPGALSHLKGLLLTVSYILVASGVLLLVAHVA